MVEMKSGAGTGTINQSRRVRQVGRKAKPRPKKRKSNKNRKRSNAVALHLKKETR